MAYGLSNGRVTDDVSWPQMRCGAVRSAILAIDWLLVMPMLMFVCLFVCLSPAQI